MTRLFLTTRPGARTRAREGLGATEDYGAMTVLDQALLILLVVNVVFGLHALWLAFFRKEDVRAMPLKARTILVAPLLALAVAKLLLQ